MKKTVIVIALIVILGALAWPKVAHLLYPKASMENAAVAPRSLATVQTMQLKPATFERKLSFNGTLVADNAIDIKSELRGKIATIVFEDGQRVETGDLIVKIESGELVAELSSVGEQLALATTNAERLQNLFSSGSVTASERDDAVSRREVLKAEERRLAVRLDKSSIRAPFAGTLGLREVSLGDLIEADTRITTLQTIDNLKVDFHVPERYQALFSTGTDLTLWVTGYEEPFSAQVRAISPRVDVSTRTIRVRADVTNQARQLRPGNYARVELISRDEAALMVPSAAVIQSMDSVSVFTVHEAVVVRKQVTTGERNAAEVQILQGLQPGEEVIISGVQSVREGQRVEVLNEVESG